MANHPARVAHLLTVPFLAEMLAPSYAEANSRTAVDVYDEVKCGLDAARLHGPLCDAIWATLRSAQPNVDEASLVELFAKSLAKKGGPKAKVASKALQEKMPALFATIDIHIERASPAARLALETPAGRAALDKALVAAAAHMMSVLKL